MGTIGCTAGKTLEWFPVACLRVPLDTIVGHFGYGAPVGRDPKPLSARNNDNLAAGSHTHRIHKRRTYIKGGNETHNRLLNKRKHKQQKQQKTQTTPDMIGFHDRWSGYTVNLFTAPGARGLAVFNC